MRGKEALVLVHLSSLDSYTQQGADAGDWSTGELLADAMAEEILKHKGPVYIVDQGWSLGRRESRPRAKLIKEIQGVPVKWIRFDEDTQEWDDFEKEIVRELRKDGVTKVAVGGIWWEDDLTGGCASETFKRLRKHFQVRKIDRILGRESDFDEDDELENPDQFEIAMKALPRCVVGGLDSPKTVSDLVYQAMHELDMWREQQDGCISNKEASAVQKFIKRFGTPQQKGM